MPRRRGAKKRHGPPGLIELKLPVEVLVRCFFPLQDPRERDAGRIARQRQDVLRCGWVSRHFRETALLVGLRLDDKVGPYGNVPNAADIVARYAPWPIVSIFVLWNHSLTNIAALGRCRDVTIGDCSGLVDVAALRSCRSVTLFLCSGVVDVAALGTCTTLAIFGCNNISTDISALDGVPNLLVGVFCGKLPECERGSFVERAAGWMLP